jgi:HSP20 family protein
MTIVRWEPLRELGTLQTEMNRLFNTVFDSPGQGNGGTLRRWMPAMDLVETGDHFVLRADLPGMGEEDVKIELEDTTLTVSGERKADHEAKGEGYYRVDRGVLEIRVPKPEARKPRRIEIGGADRQTIEG